MGERGELDSAVIYTQHGQKTYFINIKENRYRDLFMVLAESIKTEAENFERFVLNVFEEDIENFFSQITKGLHIIETMSFKDKVLPESWTMQSISGKKDRYFRFSIHKRARVLQLVIAEQKLNEETSNFARTIRIDAESLVIVLKQYQRMMQRLLDRRESRDREPLRNPKLVEKYLKKENFSTTPRRIVRKVVVKRGMSVDD